MKKNVLVLGLLFGVILCSGAVGFFTLEEDNQEVVQPNEEIEYEIHHLGPEFRSKILTNFPQVNNEALSNKIKNKNGLRTSDVGDVLEWYIMDVSTEDQSSVSAFECRAIGDFTEIWVQTDMSYRPGDWRPAPTVSNTQLTNLMNEFEDTIYPLDTQTFGMPDFHDGTNAELGDDYEDPEGKNIILISNVRDRNYYDRNVNVIIGGYYSPTYEMAFDRNIISISARNMNNVEGTIAHEYQHLIHDDHNTMDDSFLNEGCSMYAETVCGYGVPSSYHDHGLAVPDNSLSVWEDHGEDHIIADYGLASLFIHYIADNYGGDTLIGDFVQSGIPGMDGVTQTLANNGYSVNFDEVFDDWTLANLLQTDALGGLYDYDSINLNNRPRVYEVSDQFITDKTGVSFGTSVGQSGDTGVSKLGSYGVDYIKLSGIEPNLNQHLEFDGDDLAAMASWTRVNEGNDEDNDLEYYSTPSLAQNDIKISAAVDLTGISNPVLSFDTSYDIEEGWDFGFVQVSTDNGQTWTSLSNSHTTSECDDRTVPIVKENVPGLTGNSNGWINMDFDLSTYAGQEILIAFRYITDWGYQTDGWYIDNIEINDNIIDNADDNRHFEIPQGDPVDFFVNIISMQSNTPTAIYSVPLDDATESTLEGFDLSELVSSSGYLYLTIATTQGLADYKFSIVEGTGGDEDPDVSIVNPADGSTVGGIVSIEATATDDVGIDHVQYQIDGGNWIVDNTAPYQWNWDTTGLIDGQTYTITVRAYDTINQYAEESISVVVDNEVVDEKPTVSISEPNNDDTVSGTVAISADASDDKGIDHVQYQIDNGNWIVDNTAPYQWNWDTTGLINGQSYTITVRAYDTINQYAEESISVVVDNGDVHLVEDIFNGAVAGHEVDYYAVQAHPGEMSVTASWSGNTDIDVYICTAEDYSNYLARGYTTNNPETCSYDIQSAGTYYVAVRMYTQGASSTDYTLTVSYYTSENVEDTTPPTVNINSPIDGAEVSGIVTIEFSAIDTSGIASRAIMIDGVIVSTSSTHEWDTSSYAIGEHIIKCEATDASENANTGYAEITVNIVEEDVTPPTVNIISPVDGAEVSGIVTIEFSATDASGIASREIMIDGTIVSTSSTYEWDTSDYTPGEYVIRCEAIDASENANLGHAEITVVVKDTPLEDIILSISAPIEIEPTGSFDVTFSYSAAGERNVVVSLVNGGGSVFASTSILVSEGEGEETVTLTHDGTTPSGTDYVIEVKMFDLSEIEVASDTTPITVKEAGEPAPLYSDLLLLSIFMFGAIGSILLIQKKSKSQRKD